MIKNDIIIKRENDIFFHNNSKNEISFNYKYFNNFIKKYNLFEIFPTERYLDKKENRFIFNLSSLKNINKDEGVINCQNLLNLSYIEGEDSYLKENLIFFGNDEKMSKAFLFFPFYQTKNNLNEIKNDFILAKNENKIDLKNYANNVSVYKRNGILICLEL